MKLSVYVPPPWLQARASLGTSRVSLESLVLPECARLGTQWNQPRLKEQVLATRVNQAQMQLQTTALTVHWWCSGMGISLCVLTAQVLPSGQNGLGPGDADIAGC